MRKKTTSGQRFGNLLTVSRVRNSDNGKPQWLCRCDCGGEKIVRASNLQQGHTRSCGCLQSKAARMNSQKRRTHGLTGSRLERIYKGMIARCYMINHKAFPAYGGRGITVCKEWRNNRPAFYSWALANGYAENLTIDRINNNAGYSPRNCRWVNMKAQARNTRRNRLISYNGMTLPLSAWAERIGISTRTLWARFDSGWTTERALTTPLRNH